MFNRLFFALAFFGVTTALSANEDELAYRRTYGPRSYDRYDDYRARENRMLEDRYNDRYYDRYRYNYYEGPGYYNPYYYTPYYPYGLPGSDPNSIDDVYEQNVNR